MENRFNHREDFEHLVKQNADQYRMYPSEKVWKGIHNTLHTRRRWYGIGLALLIFSTGVVTWVMLGSSVKNNKVVSTLPKFTPAPPAVEKKQIAEIAIIAPVKKTSNKNSFITTADNLPKILFENLNSAADQEEENISEPPAAIVYNAPVIKIIEASHQPEARTISAVKHTSSKPAIVIPVSAPVNTISIASTIVNAESEAPSLAEEKIEDKNDIYPLTIESVINSYKHIKKRKRISILAYITPSITYRGLNENKAFTNSARNAASGTNSSYSPDINNVVTHKPDIGLQLGFTAGYPLSKKLRIIGGLQFNVSKYDIMANRHTSEIVTIALSNDAGGTNTLSTVTNYRNGNGGKADWLHNLYISASAPIGLEMKLLGNKKTYFGVSGTVQPTYVLSNRAYLISTDYKNYAEIPSLTRKWNINTGFELFAGYSTGKVKWRVGPQVRYQTMSSFKKKYPVQEHLFDFGLKLGIMLK